MAAPILQKTVRLEIEFNININKVNEETLPPGITPQALPYLQQLQQGLLSDETALLKQIQLHVVSQLQGYADDLAKQDSLQAFRAIETKLDLEELNQPDLPNLDFSAITRPVRISTIDSCLARSTISEETRTEAGDSTWETVWEDMRPHSELGKWMGISQGNNAAPLSWPEDVDQHAFLVRFLSRQKELVHLEATCPCGLVFAATGSDEWQALGNAWEEYKKHLEAYKIGTQVKSIVPTLR